jgi:hypothetical protein
VSKAKDPEKGGGKLPATSAGAKGKRKAEVICFVCGLVGHFARDYTQRKGVDKALVTAKAEESEEEASLPDEWDVTLIAKEDRVLFTKYELLLDNQSSVDIVGNEDIITNKRRANKPITTSGIQLGASPAIVDTIGDFDEFGSVYYSENSSANILSFASQVNAGAGINYDRLSDVFTLKRANGSNVYVFSRKNVAGSEGQFYVCDLRTMMMQHNERAMVQTVAENISKFTKREVGQPREARERMSFPSVPDAIDMANSCKNLGVSGRDFQIADAIRGKDASSMRGKTKKRLSPVADITVKPVIVQQQQVLSIDIMFIEKIPFLIGVATPLDLTVASNRL